LNHPALAIDATPAADVKLALSDDQGMAAVAKRERLWRLPEPFVQSQLINR
jgi:hypothetical protein